MNRFRHGRGWLLVVISAAFISSAAAQDAMKHPAVPVTVPSAILPPPVPAMASPVDYFRKLLAMSPQQRQSALANKPPIIRERILAKVNEYAALDPDDRELRLRATELRWYLMPLLQSPPGQRNAQLDRIPADIRDLARSRLLQWDLLPPPLQQEFLENERTASYFAGLSTTNDASENPAPTSAEQARWNSYSDSQRQGIIKRFNEFIGLSPVEKQQALGSLTLPERLQMEKTLKAFGKLPVPQRVQCIRAFGKFADMTPAERAEFLKNAQRWAKMTPAERHAWSDLVAHVPQWPPLPPAAIMPPPLPPRFSAKAHPLPANQGNLHTVADTNHN